MQKVSDRIGYLQAHLDDYVDKMPATIVSGIGSKQGDRPKYKAQKNWFNGVVGALGNARSYREITDVALGRRVDEFIAAICSTEFRQRHTERGDIDAANAIITEVVAHLSSTLAE